MPAMPQAWQALKLRILACLEVVYGAYNVNYIGSGTDVVYYVLHTLVCHGTLVQGITVDGSRIDTLHGCLKLGKGEALLCGRSAHEASSAVGC